MWIFLKNSFLSIVQKPDDIDTLTVRARIKGDIEAVFPEAKVSEGEGTDYRFRARIPREIVAKAMQEQVMTLTASNFKASVSERHRHDAYMGVWSVMYDFQEGYEAGRSGQLNGSSHG
ncbi:hypothetical protein G3580_09405 [Nitrogeniibacter mangrovi]|uniref:Uncharacterized protein n=1 Tax=Nitrogeniibacter mangrovi TaxID=2016596 RepID=A0A6C1B4Z0_9RHOO|nr:hypothetical protein [Nitrogeniibacter mangrovi]QID17838.1 hypothetical protein G3580_09405 [Nitrogeniibacter mangrovi]